MRTPRSTTEGAVPEPREPARVRNVALVGTSGAGKTTLVEALLVHTGAVPRTGSVDDGTATTDGEDVERRRGASAFLGVAQVEHADVKLTLLDTPGDPDLVGGLRAGLRAADAVLFVVSAAGGLDAVTAQLWAECAAHGTPRAVAVTQLDRGRADFDEAVALCQRVLDEGVVPVHVPMHDDDGSVAGLIRLLDHHVVDHSSGQRVERDADPEHVTLVEGLHGDLVEAVLAESEDDTLLDRYLDGEELDDALLAAELHRAVGRGHLTPALAVAPLQGVGVQELLDLLVQAFPSPVVPPGPAVTSPDGSPAAPLACDPDGPLVAEVVRTTTDADGGRLSYVRVRSGTLRPDALVSVSGHDVERVGGLSSPLGPALRPVGAGPAGDVCVVAGLTTARAGDTLSSPDEPLRVAPEELPEPQLPVAVEAASVDEEALAAALAGLAADDPTVRVERRPETGQLLLWCVGSTHAEVVLDLLRTRHGVEVTTRDVVVPVREVEGDGGTVRLEPWVAVAVRVPTAFARSVASDLAGRRARVARPEADEDDDEVSVVRAELPESELLTYATALRAVSHGTARFSRRPLGWEPATP